MIERYEELFENDSKDTHVEETELNQTSNHEEQQQDIKKTPVKSPKVNNHQTTETTIQNNSQEIKTSRPQQLTKSNDNFEEQLYEYRAQLQKFVDTQEGKWKKLSRTLESTEQGIVQARELNENIHKKISNIESLLDKETARLRKVITDQNAYNTL